MLPSTAVIANSSGITVGTSARNRIIRMKNAAIRPIRSLLPCVGGAFSASPVNSTSMPAGSAIARSWFSTATMPSAAARSPSCRTGCRSTRSGRLRTAGATRAASGLSIRDESFWWSSIVRCGGRAATSILLIACHALRRVEPLAGGRGEHDAERRALLAAELRVDQIGRLLRSPSRGS